MKQLLLISDSHGEKERVQAILKKHPQMDLYIHLGDLGFDPACLQSFHIVQGNHDPASYGLAKEKVIEVEECRILLVHGHQYEMRAISRVQGIEKIETYGDFIRLLEEEIALHAKEVGCHAVFHGHTHFPFDEVIHGVRVINPGSLFFNREDLTVSYACVKVDRNQLQCTFTSKALAK